MPVSQLRAKIGFAVRVNFTIPIHSAKLVSQKLSGALLRLKVFVVMNQNRIPPHLTDVPALDERRKPDGGMNPAGEAGWFLMREREDRGMTIEQASEIVGIHPYHIEAIELGNMVNMPSRVEALEMIAAYADYLGFEPEPLLQHYVSFLPAPEMAPRRHPANPQPMTSAKVLSFGKFVKLPPINIKLPSLAKMPKMPNIKHMPKLPDFTSGNGGIVASVLAAFIASSAVTWTLVPSEAPSQQQEQVADNAEPSDPMPTASTGSEEAQIVIKDQAMDGDPAATAEATNPPVVAPPPELGEDVLGAFIQENVAGVTEENGQNQVAAVEIPTRTYGSPDKSVRLVLKANRSNIWLLIEDGHGNRVATQMMNKGDVFRVPNKPGLVATVQDGGAISYIIDGEEKGVLGQPGAVLAAESLDIKKLQDRS
jgi:cytoskeleton protein RodZ